MPLLERGRSEQPRGRVGITPGFALFHMEPLGEAHLLKELRWSLGPVLPSPCSWCEVAAHGIQPALGSLVQPSPGLAEEEVGAHKQPWGWGSSCSSLSRGWIQQAGVTALFFSWNRVKAVSAAEQWLHPAPSRRMPQCWSGVLRHVLVSLA